MNTDKHALYMSEALRLAEQGRLTVSPNPMVGCLLVKNGQIIAQGYHQYAGGPHAEIHALQNAQGNSKEATAYITLEPCCHYGKTPPCTDALIAAGIKKAYIACMDPNPLVAGRGIDALRKAGIEVALGLCESAAKELNEIFFYYMTHAQPFVIAKWAMSLDGKTMVNDNDIKQISSAESQYHTHQMRQQVDAILIGANTACRDNPQLTVRCKTANTKTIKQPLRIILSGRHLLPRHLNIFNPHLPGKTMIVTAIEEHKIGYETILSEKNELCIVPGDENNHVQLASLLKILAKKGITSLLVEGGMTVLENFFQQDLINKVHVYLSPSIISTLTTKKILKKFEYTQIGKDFFLSAHCKEVSYV